MNLKAKRHKHGVKYILQNDKIDEQARCILNTQLEEWLLQYPENAQSSSLFDEHISEDSSDDGGMCEDVEDIEGNAEEEEE